MNIQELQQEQAELQERLRELEKAQVYERRAVRAQTQAFEQDSLPRTA
jgi:hypothetical protein